MPRRRFCILASFSSGEDSRMDVVAVLLGIVMFALLLALVYGIERI
jgi:hypothetical protein